MAVFGFYGCNTSKEAVKQPTDVVEDEGTKPQRDVDHGSAPSTVERVKGTVKMESDCGAVIEVTYGDVIKRYFPMNLDGKYKKEGLMLKFAFTEEESKSGAGKCEAVAAVIRVSDVTPLR